MMEVRYTFWASNFTKFDDIVKLQEDFTCVARNYQDALDKLQTHLLGCRNVCNTVVSVGDRINTRSTMERNRVKKLLKKVS